eukprot:TRINITY_DN6768_c0_g1_i1.p1 TRINITY_DN6768_c0_g1~~TRINITY_DN6768_c0_g1_i1.p1  ORF type:complete len:358 (+),score=58.02 TRINITY_DN6768_c0_g1_i1:201-1274(+)
MRWPTLHPMSNVVCILGWTALLTSFRTASSLGLQASGTQLAQAQTDQHIAGVPLPAIAEDEEDAVNVESEESLVIEDDKPARVTTSAPPQPLNVGWWPGLDGPVASSAAAALQENPPHPQSSVSAALYGQFAKAQELRRQERQAEASTRPEEHPAEVLPELSSEPEGPVTSPASVPSKSQNSEKSREEALLAAALARGLSPSAAGQAVQDFLSQEKARQAKPQSSGSPHVQTSKGTASTFLERQPVQEQAVGRRLQMADGDEVPMTPWARWWFKRARTVERQKQAEKHGVKHALLMFRKHLEKEHAKLSRLVVHQNLFDVDDIDSAHGSSAMTSNIIAIVSAIALVGALIKLEIFVR